MLGTMLLGSALLCSAILGAEPAKPPYEAILDASDAAPQELIAERFTH